MTGGPSSVVRCRYVVHGRVQGVSFRWYTRDAAQRLGVQGWVRNRRDGTVEVEAWAAPKKLSELEERLRQGPTSSRVDRVEREELPALPDSGARGREEPEFEIRATK